MFVSGPVQPPSLKLKSTQVIQLFCGINVANVLVYPFAYHSGIRSRMINRRCGGIKRGCLRGIWEGIGFGDLHFSGWGKLSCPFRLSKSQICAYIYIFFFWKALCEHTDWCTWLIMMMLPIHFHAVSSVMTFNATLFALSATPTTPAHTDQLGRCK